MSKIISSPGPVWWNSRVLTQFWKKLMELERLSETLPSAGVSTMLFLASYSYYNISMNENKE